MPPGGAGLARAPTATTPLAGAQLQRAIVAALSQEEGLLTEEDVADDAYPAVPRTCAPSLPLLAPLASHAHMHGTHARRGEQGI